MNKIPFRVDEPTPAILLAITIKRNEYNFTLDLWPFPRSAQ